MGAVRTVTIAGVGLIGGSFALALRRVGFRGRILGVSSPTTLARALELGVIDEAQPLEVAVPRSDLVYMAQPVPRIMEQLASVRALAPPHALVTDAGSTKRAIVERARELFDGERVFLGGHPMAGREGRGVDRAEGTLFEDAVYVLVPTGHSMPDSPVVQEFCGWLDVLGCRQRVMQAAEHDQIVAWTSHLPQLASTALAATVCEHLVAAGQLDIAGEGLQDMTRLAASSHEIWAGILETNRVPIDDAVDALIRELQSLRSALQEGHARSHFERGRALQERLPRKQPR